MIKLFESIHGIDPNYPDSDGLLPSAQKEADELIRIAELNELYGQSVSAIEAGQWYEARRLLEQVHKRQTGFLDTESLLRKVEKVIEEIEERERLTIQINTLYEQARGLVRSKNWRKALEKIEEIQNLDSSFIDTDRIAEKAWTELDREELVIQQQSKLDAMYPEAVRFLNDREYQAALEQWQEIVVIDPKYPDRQKLQAKSKRELAKLTSKSRGVNLRQATIAGSLVIMLVVMVWISSQPPPTSPGTNTPVHTTSAPTEFEIPSASFAHPPLTFGLSNRIVDSFGILIPMI